MSEAKVPPPPEGADAVVAWAEDSQAKAEEKNWPNEDHLKGQRTKNDLNVLKVLGIVEIVLMVSFALAFLMAFGSWVIHYTTPWHYLSPDQLAKIQSIIFSGTIGGVVTAYARKHLPKG